MTLLNAKIIPNEKTYNIGNQLISCSDIKGSRRTVVLDIAHVTILLFRNVATVWKIKMVGTIGKQLKHLPFRFSDMKSSSINVGSVNFHEVFTMTD